MSVIFGVRVKTYQLCWASKARRKINGFAYEDWQR